ncbi:IS630 family transposase, partial [Nocardia vinacea]
TFRNVRELTLKIRAFINGWNPRAKPFVWTKTAEQILAKAHRPTTSKSAH